jgi:hypothetical protein
LDLEVFDWGTRAGKPGYLFTGAILFPARGGILVAIRYWRTPKLDRYLMIGKKI